MLSDLAQLELKASSSAVACIDSASLSSIGFSVCQDRQICAGTSLMKIAAPFPQGLRSVFEGG